MSLASWRPGVALLLVLCPALLASDVPDAGGSADGGALVGDVTGDAAIGDGVAGDAGDAGDVGPELPPPPPPPPPPDPIDQILLDRAAQLRQLAKGTLPETVPSAQALLGVDLSGKGGPAAERLLAALDRAASGEPLEVIEGQPQSPDDQVVAALQAWRALPPATRAARLEAHAALVAARKARHDAVVARITELDQRRQQLEQLREGKLPTDVEARSVVEVALLPPVEPDARTRERLAQAREQLTEARLAFLRLPEAERLQLLEAHAERRRLAEAARKRAEQEAADAEKRRAEALKVREEAEKAAADREQALADAKTARTQALRQLAEERARLLGIKESQANYRAELTASDEKLEAFNVRVEAFRERVAAIRESARLGQEVAARADALFDEVSPVVVEINGQLRQVLDEISDARSKVPEAGDDPLGPIEAELSAAVKELEEARTLRSELQVEAEALTELERTSSWDRATALKSDLDLASRLRLQLVPYLSSARRSQITGFGPVGVRQAGAELELMSLSLRYRMATWPRVISKLGRDLSTSPVPVLFALGQLAVLALVFWWWRRRADGVLERLHQGFAEPQRATRSSRWLEALTWYLRRIRQPLETLVFLRLFLNVLAGLVPLPEAEFVWIAAQWLLGGMIVVRLIDAMAARRGSKTRGADPTSELRLRSLRLVGLTIVFVGLLLALTEQSVGTGAIYHWVLRTCWLLAIPIVWVLVRWWRPTIFQRLQRRRHQTPLTRWVLARQESRISPIAAALGGIFLLVEGLYRRLFRRLSDFEAGKRALAYLMRREVERQSRLVHEEKLTPLETELYSQFVAMPPPAALIDDVGAESVGHLVDLALSPDPTLVALVGERGSGKTLFTARLMQKMEPGAVIRVECGAEGRASVRPALRRALGLDEDATTEQLTEAVRERSPSLVVIDNGHHLVRPVIGGLSQLDRLLAFMRGVGGRTSWVVTLDSPTWQHVHRARGERAVFDLVVKLPAWSEEQIGRLIDTRAELFGLRPSFEGLVLPRQPDEDVELSQEERQKRAYTRILWDYVKGNPSLALRFWAQSLYRGEDERVVVRLFRTPPMEELESLPPTLYFVLRAVVQLDGASPKDVEACTLLTEDDVADALRMARTRGWIAFQDGRAKVTWRWFRPIKTVLHRRHLLIA